MVVAMPALSTTRWVLNNADSGPGSLRQAIADAKPGDVIRIPSSGPAPLTIALTSGELLIDKNLSILGPGENLLTISGSSNSRVFHNTPGVSCTLSGMTIQEGSVSSVAGIPDSCGGAILNDNGSMSLSHCMLVYNYATRGGGVFN